MKKRFVGMAAAAAFAAATVFVAPASADHSTAYCNAYDGRSTIVEIGAPGNYLFYIHDRSQTPGTGLIGVVEDHPGGTWMFMESGVQPRLQTGGDAVVFVLNDTGSDDPCNETGASDPVIF